MEIDEIPYGQRIGPTDAPSRRLAMMVAQEPPISRDIAPAPRGGECRHGPRLPCADDLVPRPIAGCSDRSNRERSVQMVENCPPRSTSKTRLRG